MSLAKASLAVVKGGQTHHVYVVELDPKVFDVRKFADKNPGHSGSKAPFYVGMTGLDPQQRFANHKAGHKANRYVRDFGLRLRPDIYQRYNPMSYEQAELIERTLAEDLRREGHAVWQA